MFTQVSDRLVLRFEPGQTTFRNYRTTANATQLYNLANALNSFQEDEAKQILRVKEYEFTV